MNAIWNRKLVGPRLCIRLSNDTNGTIRTWMCNTDRIIRSNPFISLPISHSYISFLLPLKRSVREGEREWNPINTFKLNGGIHLHLIFQFAINFYTWCLPFEVTAAFKAYNVQYTACVYVCGVDMWLLLITLKRYVCKCQVNLSHFIILFQHITMNVTETHCII